MRVALNWVDFSTFDNLNADGSVKVGSTYSKEIAPSYVVHAEVTGPKPFNSTNTYNERVEKYGLASKLTDIDKYNPDAKSYMDGGKQDARIKAQAMSTTDLNLNYLDFNVPNKPVLGVDYAGDGGKRRANWGIQLHVWGEYGGKTFPVDTVVADSEEANLEYVVATTDGQPFQLLTEISSSKTVGSYNVLSGNDYTSAAKG